MIFAWSSDVGRVTVAVAANGMLVLGPAALVSARGFIERASLIPAICGLSFAVVLEILAQSPDRILVRRNTAADRAARRFNTLHGLILLAAFQTTAVIAVTENKHPSPAESVVGAMILSGAAALRFLAIRRLGPRFSDGFMPATPEICRVGLYYLLRHPAEIGLLALPVGFAIAVGAQRWLAPIMLPLAVAACFRIWQEELALRAMFCESPSRSPGAACRGHRPPSG